MAHVWDADFEVPLDVAHQVAREECGLTIDSISLFGSGWDNTAYLANGELVFRFPRRAIAVPLLAREIEFLPLIKGDAIPVPEIVFSSLESARTGKPCVAYRLLEGSPVAELGLSDEAKFNLAEPVATFLRQLHSTALAADQCRVAAEGQEWRFAIASRVDQISQRIIENKSLYQDPRGLVKALRKCRNLEFPAERCLVHGDFYCLHLIADPGGKPSGVIDWGDVHWGSPSIDLSIFFGYFPPVALSVLESLYGPLSHATKQVAAFRALYHSIMLVHYATDKGHEPLLLESHQAIEIASRWVLELAPLGS